VKHGWRHEGGAQSQVMVEIGGASREI
jgi:hypothetical protein